MFIIKKKYFLYIENTHSIDLKLLTRKKNIYLIYRNFNKENLQKIIKFKKECRKKGLKFYIANDFKLAINCGADGVYLSAYNKEKKFYSNVDLIGSAHNFKEIYHKQKQGCKTIILSRLFKTNYKNKSSFLSIVKFNLIIKNYTIDIVPLGGIRNSNLLKLNLINSNGLALLSEVKKKPAIIRRLF